MDLAKKILNSIAITLPIALSPDDVHGHDKELQKLMDAGVVQRRAALTFPCGACGSYCEIKTLENRERVILCDSCEDARLYTLTDKEGYEFGISLPILLSNLLKELEFSIDNINAFFKDRLWSLGIHDINGTSREILFLRDAQDSEAEIFSFLAQKKASHPIVLSTISQRRLLNTEFILIPIETLLTSRGSGIFSKKRFEEILGRKGQTVSRESTALGSSELVLEKDTLLHSPDGFGNYQREKLEPMEHRIIENLYRRGCADKSKWHSRTEIASWLSVQEKSLSNAFTAIRKISKKVDIEIVEQHKSTKKYHINPDLVPK